MGCGQRIRLKRVERWAFWIGVGAAEHARGGRDGGFAQLGLGKHIVVKSLEKGDWINY